MNYNPTGYKDETIESCSTSYIRDYIRVLESFNNSDHVETEIDPDNYSFYTFSITKYDDQFPDIKIFPSGLHLDKKLDRSFKLRSFYVSFK